MPCPTVGSDRCVSAAHGNSPRSIPAVHFDSPKTISAAAPRPPEPPCRDDDGSEEECEDDQDEKDRRRLSDGRILTLYPADGRAHRERVRRISGKDQQRVSSLDSTLSSSDVDELERIEPGTARAGAVQEDQLHGVPAAVAHPGPGKEAEPEGREGEVRVPLRGAEERAGAVKEDDSGEEEEGKKGGGKPRRRGEWDMAAGRRRNAPPGGRSCRTSKSWSGSSPLRMASAARVTLGGSDDLNEHLVLLHFRDPDTLVEPQQVRCTVIALSLFLWKNWQRL
ncbi:hypothetical protein MUK42_31951 [Musa troglodytarum]|uniref:Uncharacterized protein n=1 Tax=Musa troglodytarum TaxID=320322 RepID=A0A9E7FGJ4_9LILI|nr:hypothetical protein MUK42_31951 [Musa troglodytarum]